MENKIDQETQEKIQELQGLEQTLQQLIMQKQAFQFELNETENALTEIEKSKDDVFKIIGQIMIKSSKTQIEEDLKNKQKLLKLRLDSIEKQEKTLSEQSEKLREEVMKKLK
jgi:prefoldin beta subunit